MARRLTTNQEIPGSTPGMVKSLFIFVLIFALLCGEAGIGIWKNGDGETAFPRSRAIRNALSV